jgi:hypothetical protein
MIAPVLETFELKTVFLHTDTWFRDAQKESARDSVEAIYNFPPIETLFRPHKSPVTDSTDPLTRGPCMDKEMIDPDPAEKPLDMTEFPTTDTQWSIMHDSDIRQEDEIFVAP